jgi:thymidine kinase
LYGQFMTPEGTDKDRELGGATAVPNGSAPAGPAPRPSAGPHVRRALHTGRIEVIAGSMFSGKTEELIRRVKRALYARQIVQAFKPRIDNRYDATRIVSHGEIAIDAVAVATSESLFGRVEDATQLIAIDEAQFFDRGIVEVANALADSGRRVVLAGLDQDYMGRPFPPMPDLMAIAEEVTKVRAVCSVCGSDACRSQRLQPEAGTVLVGGADKYEARCRACFRARDVRPAPEPPDPPVE